VKNRTQQDEPKSTLRARRPRQDASNERSVIQPARRDENQQDRKSPEELVCEQSIFFTVSEIWRSIIDSAPAKTALKEYSISYPVVNFTALAIGMVIYFKTNTQNKAKKLASQVPMNAVLPVVSSALSESVLQSLQLYHKIVENTGNQELAVMESFEKFFNTVISFEGKKDLVPIFAVDVLSLIETVCFSITKRAAGKLMIDPAMGTFIDLYAGLTGSKAGTLAEIMLSGFAKGIDKSLFNVTNFEAQLSNTEYPKRVREVTNNQVRPELLKRLRVEAKEIGERINADSLKSGAMQNTTKTIIAAENSGLRRRRY